MATEVEKSNEELERTSLCPQSNQMSSFEIDLWSNIRPTVHKGVHLLMYTSMLLVTLVVLNC